jgi:hypothetical protein
MQNPFKTGDLVLTKVKGKDVQAAVSQTWRNEVQVKTADGELMWRTMYTVWRPSEAPLQRAAKATAAKPPADAGQGKDFAPKPIHKKTSLPRKAAASKSQRRKRR